MMMRSSPQLRELRGYVFPKSLSGNCKLRWITFCAIMMIILLSIYHLNAYGKERNNKYVNWDLITILWTSVSTKSEPP
jgi:hypothetical protein